MRLRVRHHRVERCAARRAGSGRASHPGAVGGQLQPRRGGARRTGRTRRRRAAGLGLRHRRGAPRAQEGRALRHRARARRLRRTRRRATALRLAARRRHRRRAHRAVRLGRRAHRTGPSRHQPRHLRPRRAARRAPPGRARAGPVPRARSARLQRRAGAGAHRPLQLRLACTSHAGPVHDRVRAFVQARFAEGVRVGIHRQPRRFP